MKRLQHMKKKLCIISIIAFICLFIFWHLSVYVSHKIIKSHQYKPPPQGMVFIPPGEFLMGSNAPDSEFDEKPLRSIFVNGIYVDQFEVTNAQYKKIIPNHQYPEDAGMLPVTGILRFDAEAYCHCLNKRLPSGIEWEKASRGTDGRIYPWGNKLASGTANIRGPGLSYGKLLPVGSFPNGVSPYGCYDMSGNAWEWVSDEIITREFGSFKVDYIRGIVRGGGFNYSPFQARTSYQGFEDPGLTCNDVGFRCAKDAVIDR